MYLLNSVQQKVDSWQYHLTEDTQHKYGYPLHSLAIAVLEAHNGHPSSYQFPLPPNYTQHVTALADVLKQPLTLDYIPVFHTFMYPLLSWQPSIIEDNKWSMVLECWLALYTLKPEGNFCEAPELTGILAKLEYHCCGAILYQAHLHRHEFPNTSLYT